MLFQQVEFVLLMLLVLGFLRVVRNFRVQKTFLLIVSYYFYAYWDWRFACMLAGTTTLDWLVSRGLGRTDRPGLRKVLLSTSLIVNLGVLAYFKYCNFFVQSAAALLAPFGLHPGTLAIILPAGISFYTFQSLSYTIDVYRRELPVCRSLPDYALFVSFFPQLIAGPIVRASDLLPQFESPRKMSWSRTYEGLRQFVFGMAKKVLVADTLAFTVDTVFAHAAAFDAATTWLAVICYAFQIYCDFSGYSDMAIGMARIMGYDLQLNFNLPYLATSIRDFWRRWHISLSTWLRDYLYVPLGGNRKGPRRTYVNLMLTMVLGGLWHGAAWTFVAWGALHSVSLAVHRHATRNKPRDYESARSTPQKLVGWAGTMLIVLLGWVLFRAAGNFPLAVTVLGNMLGLGQGRVHWLPPYSLLIVSIMIALHAMHAIGRTNWLTLPAYCLASPTLMFTLIWLIVIFHPRGFHPFIYFQF